MKIIRLINCRSFFYFLFKTKYFTQSPCARLPCAPLRYNRFFNFELIINVILFVFDPLRVVNQSLIVCKNIATIHHFFFVFSCLLFLLFSIAFFSTFNRIPLRGCMHKRKTNQWEINQQVVAQHYAIPNH